MNESEPSPTDLLGLGEVAKAIPASVYEDVADTAFSTFEQLIAPVTATTDGLGRYLRQKFDNMVAAEKAVAIYSTRLAMARAHDRAIQCGSTTLSPRSSKAFIRAIEETSRETDAVLHELWTNLIASQLVVDAPYSHFVETLSHLGREEAMMLLKLLPFEEIGEHGGGYLGITEYNFSEWRNHADSAPAPWTISCSLLCELGLATPKCVVGNKPDGATILHLTKMGISFMAAVNLRSEPEPMRGRQLA